MSQTVNINLSLLLQPSSLQSKSYLIQLLLQGSNLSLVGKGNVQTRRYCIDELNFMLFSSRYQGNELFWKRKRDKEIHHQQSLVTYLLAPHESAFISDGHNPLCACSSNAAAFFNSTDIKAVFLEILQCVDMEN